MGHYPTLELGQPGNEPCPDAPNEASTLYTPGASKLFLQVSVNAIMVELGLASQGKVGAGPGSVTWQPPRPFLPVIAALNVRFDAVRVRNYTKGAKAQVLASAE